VTHVVTVAQYDALYPSRFKYHLISVADANSEDLLGRFHDTLRFIANARHNKGGVFVHCRHGVSRSASVVLAYLLTLRHIPSSLSSSSSSSTTSITTEEATGTETKQSIDNDGPTSESPSPPSSSSSLKMRFATFEDGYRYLRDRRPRVGPNDGFLNQVRHWRQHLDHNILNDPIFIEPPPSAATATTTIPLPSG
jgi:hypothetical protein